MKLWNPCLRVAGCLPLLCAAGLAAAPEPIQLASGWMLQDAGKVTENGEALSGAGYQPAAWHRATVPGTVLTSLVNDGIYPEPLYGENNRPDKIPDTLCRTTWWYRDVFTVPDSYAGDTSPGFSADHDFKGGNTGSSRDEIDLSATNSAPAEVYQSERWGDCSYIIPVGKEGPRTVRLHFAEVRFGPGERKFNVDINGRRVLTDFDIAAAAGKDRALVKDFDGINPDSDGNIIITFSRGSADEPKICGIQILK